jgi:type II secretory pathway pseudopilin PulG
MTRRRAFTLIEMMIASLALVAVAAGFVALTAASARGFARTAERSDVAVPVSQAVQSIARDLQQAKIATVVATHHVRINFPIRNADGSFTRSQTDNVNTVEYFRANANNQPSSTGTFLVRRVAGVNPRRICRNVTQLVFNNNLAGSVTVTLTARGATGATFGVTQRAMFMRNN